MRREPPVRLMRRTGTCTRHFKVIVELEKKEEKKRERKEKEETSNFLSCIQNVLLTRYSVLGKCSCLGRRICDT